MSPAPRFGKRRRGPKKRSDEEPTEEELVAEWLQEDPAFRILTMDGLSWIDPHTGTLVEAPFGWEQAAAEWLLAKRPWRKAKPHGVVAVRELRWRHFLRQEIGENPRLRHFDDQGRWLNPYAGRWETGVRRDGNTITADTLKDIAALLARDPDVANADLQSDAVLERILQAPVDAASAGGSGGHRAPDPPRTDQSTPRPGYSAPAGSGQRRRISGKRGEGRQARGRLAGASLAPGYQVMARIGSGGMSTVYRARHLSADREVALKILTATGERTDTFAERFMREAKAASSINNPHVIEVYDYGRNGETLYMSMELMPGGDAESLMVERGSPLSECEALQVIRSVTAGLVAIHDHGVIHRDIKPSNIFLDDAGNAKLGDLGLAKHGNADFTVTVDGAAVGTPAFMAPEQARGSNELSTAVDTYAIGASLYALLAGRPPFTGPNVYSVVRQVVSEPFPDVRQYNRAVRPITAALIEHTTAKNPTDRFPEAATLLEALDGALADCPDVAAEPTEAGVHTATVRRGHAHHDEQEAHEPSGGHAIALRALGWQLDRHQAVYDDRDVLITRPWADGFLVICATAHGEISGERLESVCTESLDEIAPIDHSSPAHLANLIEARLDEAELPAPPACSVVLCESDGLSLSTNGGTRPLLFTSEPGLQLSEIGFADPALGAHHDVRREHWQMVPDEGLVVIASPGVTRRYPNRRIALDLLGREGSGDDHLGTWLGAQFSRATDGELDADATILVLRRLADDLP